MITTITDKDITFAVNRARGRGIKVCLKPVVNCGDGMWRAMIDFPDEDMLGRDLYSAMPWDFTHLELSWSEEEQADFYDSCLSAFHDKEWFAGVCWWDWSTEVYDTREEALDNTGFDIHLKRAEAIVKDWYTRN